MDSHSGPVPRRSIRILSVGEDQFLLSSRELLLSSAGYQVITVDGDGLIDELHARECDIALLCHTLRAARAARLTAVLRELNPHIEVLRVSRFHGDQLPGLHHAPAEPGSLLLTIEQLLGAPDETSGRPSVEAVRLPSLRRERRSAFRFHSGDLRKTFGFSKR